MSVPATLRWVLLITCRQGTPSQSPQLPTKVFPHQLGPFLGGGRDSGLPFLCPPCTEGWGSQFFPHASPCGLAAAELQIAEGRVNSESGKLQGTSCKRHLHNPNEPEMSSRGKKKKTLQETMLIAALSLQLASLHLKAGTRDQKFQASLRKLVFHSSLSLGCKQDSPASLCCASPPTSFSPKHIFKTLESLRGCTTKHNLPRERAGQDSSSGAV